MAPKKSKKKPDKKKKLSAKNKVWAAFEYHCRPYVQSVAKLSELGLSVSRTTKQERANAINSFIAEGFIHTQLWCVVSGLQVALHALGIEPEEIAQRIERIRKEERYKKGQWLEHHTWTMDTPAKKVKRRGKWVIIKKKGKTKIELDMDIRLMGKGARKKALEELAVAEVKKVVDARKAARNKK